MIREDLLQRELKQYGEWNNEMKPMRYNRDFIFSLFRKYRLFAMTEHTYCCYGEEICCWNEIYDEGIWNKSLKDVRRDILSVFRDMKNILRSTKNGHRMYVSQDEEMCRIYIYGRDAVKSDFHIWFGHEEFQRLPDAEEEDEDDFDYSLIPEKPLDTTDNE